MKLHNEPHFNLVLSSLEVCESCDLALNLGTSLTGMFEKVVGPTRAASENRVKLPKNSKLRESIFLLPACKLWNRSPKSLVEAKSETIARKEIRLFVKSLPL